MNSKIKEYISMLLLLFAALIWGSSFVAQELGARVLPTYTFNGLRMLVGSLVLLPVIFISDRISKPENIKGWNKQTLIAGVCCGLALFFATSCQQMGLTLGTTAGKSGFITTLYIVVVPVIGLFLKRKAGLNVWIAVAIACVGLYLICVSENFTIATGDLVTMLCAFFFSFQILIIDHYAPMVDGVRLSCLQFLVVAVISIPFALLEKAALENIIQGIYPILYVGVMSCGVAYTLQIITQKNLKPEIASLLMSFESVFAGLTGWLILDNQFTSSQLVGCICMFVAVLVSQFLNIPVKKNYK